MKFSIDTDELYKITDPDGLAGLEELLKALLQLVHKLQGKSDALQEAPGEPHPPAQTKEEAELADIRARINEGARRWGSLIGKDPNRERYTGQPGQ
jgi:hypothetical protein